MFNPSRLRVARKKRRFNKTRLAELVGVNLRVITAYESGEYAPAPDTMSRLAQVLNFPADFFLGEDLYEPSLETASFRSLARMTAGTREAALASGALAMLLHDWIERRFSLPSCQIPDLREEDPETAAIALRHEWGLGERPVRNMLHLLESKGIRVFSMVEDSIDIDAFSLWRDATPFVFLNTLKSAEHSRFDAAHELGHLVLHRQAQAHGKEAEQEANLFASSFLMPRSSVLARAPVLPNLRALIELKKQWIVSVAALAYRLHALNLIKDWHYRNLCIEISQHGYRAKEPAGAPSEMSQVLGKVFQALRSDGITKTGLAHDLNYNVEDLEQVIFGLVMTGLQGGGGQSGVREANQRSIHLVK
ncbi:MAG TPA: XRE family transcriptional regulator [Xanthomonadales bacterium]|nr:XRE family transcriptional regulator [Xanthomonadales bacterium]